MHRRHCRATGPWLSALILLAAGVVAAAPPAAPVQVLEVGPGQRLKSPAEAAREARDGALVKIQAGFYLDDVAVWTQNDLHITGIDGMARLLTRGETAEDKAIWVFKGRNVTVEHVSFQGARSSRHNGAGIRFEGVDLTLRHCRFHDNQMGLLTSDEPDSTVRIESSEFYRNTVDYRRHGKLGHNIYVGRNAALILRENHVHSARIGHLVKSRARSNTVLYNRLTDESGRASYLIDLAEGGHALIMGNLLQQSVASENAAVISFAAEANRNAPDQKLYVVYNTLRDDRPQGVLVRNHAAAGVLVANNLVQGDIRILEGRGLTFSNLVLPDVGLANPGAFDFHLTTGSLAVDAARRDVTDRAGNLLLPDRQYRHPMDSEPRVPHGPPDIGAYELKKDDAP